MRKFTPAEDRFLLENYLTIPAKRMGKILGRTEGTARQELGKVIVESAKTEVMYHKASGQKRDSVKSFLELDENISAGKDHNLFNGGF